MIEQSIISIVINENIINNDDDNNLRSGGRKLLTEKNFTQLFGLFIGLENVALDVDIFVGYR